MIGPYKVKRIVLILQLGGTAAKPETTVHTWVSTFVSLNPNHAVDVLKAYKSITTVLSQTGADQLSALKNFN